ncbi:MAG: sialate O-acetylesterase [Chitinophagales bacterium]
MKALRLLSIHFLLLFLTNSNSFAKIELSQLISNNMVLQRGIEVPVWGWASKGTQIKITFREKEYTAESDQKTGRWEVRFPSMEAGGPYQMTIEGEGETIVLQNIMVGDVWLCSGQSNMQWEVGTSDNAEEEIANAKDDKIRHFKVKRAGSKDPMDRIPTSGEWTVCSPKTVANYTAVGYFFAKELRQTQNVAIGLLHTSWGGSRIEAWTSAEALKMDDPYKVFQELEEKAKNAQQDLAEKLEAKHGEMPTKDAGWSENETALWAAPSIKDTDWKTMTVPMLWEEQDLPGFDGVVWFRKTIQLTETEVKAGITLGLGSIDDSDWSYINGHKIGGMLGAYNMPRVYKVEAENLKMGENTITVRVEDTGYGGGFHGVSEDMFLKTNARVSSLAGDWKYKIGAILVADPEFRPIHTPTMLYNQMLHPILGYGIKGVIWYQGESNTHDEKAYQYRYDFPTMIEDWRTRWGQGDFPFLFVQLANFMKAPEYANTPSNWAMLRESQSKTLETTAKTGQAVIIDIGEAEDIHPRNKQDVGKRLALSARKIAYGEDIVYAGPSYKSHKVKGNKVHIELEHIGSGLVVRNKYGYVNGFAIAAKDQQFVWAKARIEGNEIVVWSDSIDVPIAIRYAWADNPGDVNLYNEEGLPACPFRTDDWEE